jgi:hypothetical protein
MRRRTSPVWTKWPVKPAGFLHSGSGLGIRHTQYFVEAATRGRAQGSWFRRVVLPAIISAVLTIVALTVLIAVAEALTPPPQLVTFPECPSRGCPDDGSSGSGR